MNTSLSWIKKYVPDLDVTAQEYTDAMTLSGTKVEGFEKLDADLDKIVIGQIEKIERHPDADKLIICQDNEGSGEELRRIIGDLSMAYFGFYAQEHHGGIYRRATGNGARYISVFADGETRDSGKNCWKYW